MTRPTRRDFLKSAAAAGLATGEQIIEDEMCVAKSFPDFWEKFEIFSK